MASYNKKTKRGYSGSQPVDGNLARKPNVRELERRLDRSGRMDFDQLYRYEPETAAERNARRRAQRNVLQRPAQHVSPMVLLGLVCTGFLMVVLLLCYVRLNTISRSIVAMKTEISALEVENVSLTTQYEQAFDLSAVKDAAAEAGMSQPSDSQIFYITLPGEDQATAYHEDRRSWLDSIESAIDYLKSIAAGIME